MASIDQINSIYDIAALTAQQQAVEALVNKTINQIKAAKSQNIDFNVNTKSFDDYNKKVKELEKNLDSLKTSTANAVNAQTKITAATNQNTQAIGQTNDKLSENIALRKRLQTSLDSYKSSLKEDAALVKAGTISQAEYRKRVLESSVAIEKYKARISEINKEIKNSFPTQKQLQAELKKQEKAADDAGNEYKQLSAAYNEAALKAKNYNLTLGANHPITLQATKTAKDLSTQLKVIDASVGQSGRNVGNYTEGIVGAFKKMFGFLRTAANVLPGVGISGLILGIGTALTAAVSAFGLFNSKLSDTARQSKILKDITDESSDSISKESTSLDILRASIESTEVPMETRLQGVKDLRELYPDYFKDLTDEQILTGNVANAYDLAAAAIIRKARASAAASQIEKNAAKELKIEQEELTDREETNKRIKTATADTDESGVVINTQKEVQQILKDAFFNRRKLRQQEQADIKKDNDFLLKIAVAGAKETIKIDEIKTKAVKKTAAPKGRDIAEANRKAQFEILKAELEFQKQVELSKANDQQRAFDSRLLALENYGRVSQRLIEEQAKFEKGAADLTKTEVLKIEKDKTIALEKLYIEFNEKLLAVTKNFALNYETSVTTLMKTVSSKIPAELQKILDKFSDAQAKAIKKHGDDLKKLQEDIKTAATSLANELEGLFFDIFTNQIERQKNAVQEQIDLLEQQKQKDIEVANQTITNAADRADAIAIIEARAAAKRQQLELRQRQLDQQKARFEKARAIAEIIQSTAIAVVNALAQVKTLGPGAIALAAVIGAIGAVQIARILAQPIPKYKEGTQNHPGGVAIVGDGGRPEGIQLPDGSVFKTPAVATVVDMPQGSKVYKDYANMPLMPNFELNAVDTTAELRKGFGQVVGAIKRIPQPVIHAEKAWTVAHRSGNSFRNYLNRSI